jgi:hypothetical protein
MASAIYDACMINGDRHLYSKVGVLGLAVVMGLGACTTSTEQAQPGAAIQPAPQTSSAPAVKYFGPDGYGKITIGITEKAALATGDLQASPVSTVVGADTYAFTGGPKPDPKRMAADAKLEAAVAKAEKDKSDKSAKEYADEAQLFADSAQRSLDRLVAYLSAGGAKFRGGKLDSLAAPKGAATEAGIKRGSTLAELKAAYGAQGLKSTGKDAYELPVAGHPGWKMRFELEKGAVLYMSLSAS